MPKDLTTPKKSLKQLEKENNRSLKKQNEWGVLHITRIHNLMLVTFYKIV